MVVCSKNSFYDMSSNCCCVNINNFAIGFKMNEWTFDKLFYNMADILVNIIGTWYNGTCKCFD